MSEDDSPVLEDATPDELKAEERRIAALNTEILDLQREGWIWNKAESNLPEGAKKSSLRRDGEPSDVKVQRLRLRTRLGGFQSEKRTEMRFRLPHTSTAASSRTCCDCPYLHTV